MLGRALTFGVIAASVAAPFFLPIAARAEIINLSCDDGGMLLMFDTDHLTVTDQNPFQQTKVVAPLTMTADSFAWHEGAGSNIAGYHMDRATRVVSARAHGAAVPFPIRNAARAPC